LAGFVRTVPVAILLPLELGHFYRIGLCTLGRPFFKSSQGQA